MKPTNRKIKQISTIRTARILDALKIMDSTGKRLLLVFDAEEFIGLLSIGDIQRAIIKNIGLTEQIHKILRPNFRTARSDQDLLEIKNQMLLYRTECMPVLDNNNKLINVLFWEDVFGKEIPFKKVELNLPVVIMAGGKGTRLKPLTNVIPKALLPIGEKTILEKIIEQFRNYGCTEFYISLNHKAEMIKDYLQHIQPPLNNIKYFQEAKQLGTAGSLYLLKNQINTTFFVSNCDILVFQDIDEIYKYHTGNGNLITIVGALKHYQIPYGTIDISEDGMLKTLSEKPEFTLIINSGLYLLEPDVLDAIQDNSFLNITDLIQRIKIGTGRVGVFPITEKSWQDIGNWDNYKNLLDL